MYLLLVLVCLSVVSGQVVFNGPCQMIRQQAESYVDVLSLLGLWYQQGRISNYREHGANSTLYYFILDLEHVVVTHTETVGSKSISWNASITRSPDDAKKFMITYPDLESYSYFVAATNYKEYALVYGCKTNADRTRSVWGWLLSRKKRYTPSLKMMKEIRAALRITPDLNVTWIPVYQSGRPRPKSINKALLYGEKPRTKGVTRITERSTRRSEKRPFIERAEQQQKNALLNRNYWKKIIHLF